jgi:2-keto-3-deoxy-6-phosphogluconate aldolase
MAKFTKPQVQDTMKSTGMIPVFYHPDVDVAKGVIDAAYKGGVRIFEFTNRGGNAYDVFVQLLKHIEQYNDLILGIGTIMDSATAQKFIEAGAHFIVSPILNTEMAETCRKADVMWVPGCATLTEIVTGKNHGAEVIKVFPGSVLGPGFVSAVMPVVPGLQLMPTGGVEPTEQNLGAWFNAGVICVGMGSQLFTKEMINGKQWKELEEKVRSAMKIIESLKK